MTRATLNAYYRLTKPGIIRGNVITAAAGFWLGSGGHIQWGLFAATVVGIALVIGAACVINNYIDRGIDAKMTRTKQRALASGTIPVAHALVFGGLLAASGSAVLALWANWWTVGVGLVGVFAYLVLYSIAKRRSRHGTLVGTISGATPIVAGYCTAANQFDVTAGLLFAILVLWQMPHFFAIAIYRLDDYRAAGIPVWPLRRGMASTKRHMLAYVAAFIVAVLALTAVGTTGYLYAVVMLVLGLTWLRLAARGRTATNDTLWAKQMFRVSLAVLLLFSIMISIDSWLI